MTHGSLFSGIGGFDLAASWLGWTNVFSVEKDSFCNRVLAKNFPHVKKYTDIFTFDGKEYEGRIDVISGGFPCQPFSIQGLRKGTEDERFLWGEMLRVITEIKPRFIVAENVGGLLSIENGVVFERICAEMEGAGYEVQSFIVPAVAVGAAHLRERIWFVANAMRGGRQTRKPSPVAGEAKKRDAGLDFENGARQSWGQGRPPILRGGDGMPNKLDANRLEALGNAIVPQVAYEVFKAIEYASGGKND